MSKDKPGIPADEIDAMVRSAVLAADEAEKRRQQNAIRELAVSLGIFPASIQGLYEAAGKGLVSGFTVPAINIRGLTYQVARAVFRAALKAKVGAFTFEIARSEIGYTAQRPAEYTACILAAAMREGFKGPVFIQGDHYQASRAKYASEPDKELSAIKDLIKESIGAGFFNIDIDSSTLVNLDKKTLEEEQEENARVTAVMTEYVREIQPAGVTVSVGGEIGEIGKGNSTPEDLKAFMAGYRRMLGKGIKGISKISVQTGTTHGGVVLPDGSIAEVQLDFKVLETLSDMARKEYGMGGAVQHGASTLPDEAFHLFPQAGAIEVHLATGFQNIIYDSPSFPKELLNTIQNSLSQKYAGERKSGETDEQFYYKTRKRAFGDFKKEMWSLPEAVLTQIGAELEDRFTLLFDLLKVGKTVEVVERWVGKGKS